MSVPIDLEKAHAPKDVDVSAAGRGVWLVKVKHLARNKRWWMIYIYICVSFD